MCALILERFGVTPVDKNWPETSYASANGPASGAQPVPGRHQSNFSLLRLPIRATVIVE